MNEQRDLLTNPTVLLQDAVINEMVASYIARVRAEGVEVPEDAVTPELRFTLAELVARTRWGPAEALVVSANLDPEIKAALAQVPAARELLQVTPAP